MAVEAPDCGATCVDAQHTRALARTMRHAAREVRGQSVIAIARAAASRGVSRICGSSDLDAPLIVALITHASLCVPCIARKVGVPDGRVTESLRAIGDTFKLRRHAGRCDACLNDAVVYSLR